MEILLPSDLGLLSGKKHFVKFTQTIHQPELPAEF